MKKTILLMLISFILVAFTACGTPATNNKINNNQNTNFNYKLEQLTKDDILDTNLLNEFEGLAKQRGFTIVELDDKKILFIALGQKNTSGYEIKSENIKEEDGKILISFIEAEPTEMAAQVISYPYELYQLEGDINDITKVEVRNDSGDLFNYLEVLNEA